MSIVEGLIGLQQQCTAMGLGGLLTVLVEGAKYMEDAHRLARDELRGVKDRVKTLERAIRCAPPGAPPGTHNPSSTYPSPVNPPSAHDLALMGADFGSNGGAAGAVPSAYLVVNAVNTTGVGAGGSAGFVNVTTGDRQLVRSHVVQINAAGTPGTPSTSSTIRLASVTFPSPFDRPPKVRLQAVNPDGAAINVYANVYSNGSGYDLVSSGGTITAGRNYNFSVTVDPN